MGESLHASLLPGSVKPLISSQPGLYKKKRQKLNSTLGCREPDIEHRVYILCIMKMDTFMHLFMQEMIKIEPSTKIPLSL